MPDQTISAGWREIALGELVEIIKESWKVGDAHAKYIGLEHIDAGKLNLSGFGISSELASNKFIFRSGDILFGKLRPYFRKVVIPKFDGVCSTDISVIRAKDGHDQKFLFYFIANPVFINKSMGANTGTHMPRADWRYLEKTIWNIPPLPEQRAIAAVLSSLDDKIELLREQNKTLEATAQAIFKEWFGKYSVDRPEELPEGWRVGKIGDLIGILSGFAFKSPDFVATGKYGLVTIRNVQDGSFVQDTKDRLAMIPSKTPDYCRLKTGDVLLSLTGNVGRVCHVVGKNYLLNQRVAKLQPKNESDYSFAYLFFRQESMIGLLESISAGTAQQNLSPIKTGELEAIIPSRSQLDEFSEVANPMLEKILSNLEQIQALSTLRDTLLPKLMRGEVRVNF